MKHERKQIRRWTKAEKESLYRGILEHGVDKSKLVEIVVTRSKNDIKNTISQIRQRHVVAPKSVYDKIKECDVDNPLLNRFTEDEEERLLAGLRLHGKDWVKIQKVVKTKGKLKCSHYALRLRAERQRDTWTETQTQIVAWLDDFFLRIASTSIKFEAGVLKHGLDFDKIAEDIPEMTAADVRKRVCRIRRNRQNASPEVTRICKDYNTGFWSDTEHEILTKALLEFGKDIKAISERLTTKPYNDISSQVTKYKYRLRKKK